MDVMSMSDAMRAHAQRLSQLALRLDEEGPVDESWRRSAVGPLFGDVVRLYDMAAEMDRQGEETAEHLGELMAERDALRQEVETLKELDGLGAELRAQPEGEQSVTLEWLEAALRLVWGVCADAEQLAHELREEDAGREPEDRAATPEGGLSDYGASRARVVIYKLQRELDETKTALEEACRMLEDSRAELDRSQKASQKAHFELGGLEVRLADGAASLKQARIERDEMAAKCRELETALEACKSVRANVAGEGRRIPLSREAKRVLWQMGTGAFKAACAACASNPAASTETNRAVGDLLTELATGKAVAYLVRED